MQGAEFGEGMLNMSTIHNFLIFTEGNPHLRAFQLPTNHYSNKSVTKNGADPIGRKT